MRINNQNQNFKNISALAKPLSAFYNANATIPTLAIETGVTLGRANVANKTFNKQEAFDRLIEQGVSAVIWIYGVQMLKKIGDFIGKNILKIPQIDFDIGFDYLRNPIKNNKINIKNPKTYGFKAANILTSTALATYFIGFILPKISYKLSKKAAKKNNKEDKKDTLLKNYSFDDFKRKTKPKNKEIKFTSLADNMASAAHILENNSTARLFITDFGVISGRCINAKTPQMKVGNLFRDIISMYFYLCATKHTVKLLNKMPFLAKNADIDPKILDLINQMLIENKDKINFDDFLKSTVGEISKEDLEKLDGLFKDKKVVSLDEFSKTFPSNFEKAKLMTQLQPFFEENPILDKNEAKDVLSNGLITEPKFLKSIFEKATNGASSDQFKYVSAKKLDSIRQSIVDYMAQIDSNLKGEEFNKDFLQEISNTNIRTNFIRYGVGVFVSILALGYLIPKVQYMIVKALSNKDKTQNKQ